MRVARVRSFRSLVVGMVIGLLIGSVGHVYSAMGKPGWDRQSPQFKAGYIIGALDILRMIKRSDPSHDISMRYTIPREAKAVNWLFHVERLFAEPKNKDLNTTQIIAFAGSDMEEEFGGDIATMSGLEALGRALENRREAIARGDVKESPPEVIAKRQRSLAKEKVRSRCMGECRKTCRDSCDAKVKAEFPQDEIADDKKAAEKED